MPDVAEQTRDGDFHDCLWADTVRACGNKRSAGSAIGFSHEFRAEESTVARHPEIRTLGSLFAITDMLNAAQEPPIKLITGLTDNTEEVVTSSYLAISERDDGIRCGWCHVNVSERDSERCACQCSRERAFSNSVADRFDYLVISGINHGMADNGS